MYRVFIEREEGSPECFVKDGYRFQFTASSVATTWEQAGVLVYQYNGKKGGGKAKLLPRAQREISLTKLENNGWVVIGHAGDDKRILVHKTEKPHG